MTGRDWLRSVTATQMQMDSVRGPTHHDHAALFAKNPEPKSELPREV